MYLETLGLFYLRALRSLGHRVHVWDPRRMPTQPKMAVKPDLTIVIKEFVNPKALPRPRVYVFPDQTMHEDYSARLDEVAPLYDHVFFCMVHEKEVMNRYGASLLPFAMDPEIHRPISTRKTIDVSFVGTNRPRRMELVGCLAEHGVKIKIWGNNWPTNTPNYVGKAIYLDEKRRVYNSSKIVLNAHYLIGVNMRFFETLGMRSFLLSDKVDGVENLGFEDGVHYVSYHSLEDLVDKIESYLERPLERERIANQGHDLVKKRHTYVHRVKELLECASLRVF